MTHNDDHLINDYDCITTLSNLIQNRFVVLESKNRALNERTSSLNAKLAQLKRAQQRLERLHSADGGSLQRRELLHALKRTRELQQQVDELRNSSGGQAPEAKKLQMLAEAKLGKQRVDSLIEQKEQLQRQLNELQTKLEAYNQPDTLTKIAELKAKQTMMQEFLGDFQVKYETELNLKQELSRQVEIAGKRKQRIERQVKRLQVRRSPELTQLHSTWRSLKMDLESIRQLESKAETEAKELQQSCISLRNDLQRFEKVDDLRDQLNLEWESEKRLNEQLVVRHQTALENVQQKKEQVDKLNDEIEQTDLANRISVMEAKLLQLQIAKRTASDTLQQFDYVDLKTNALQMVTKLNQRLLGF